MHDSSGDPRRLFDKLTRELVRCESHAREHAEREARRIGEAPPVVALRAVAAHAEAMRPRLGFILDASASPSTRARFRSTMTLLRARVIDRMIDAERAFRGALLDLRHGVDVVSVLREVARRDREFAVIRWCDDWLVARRPLVARLEAQLGWFAENQNAHYRKEPAAPIDPPPPSPAPTDGDSLSAPRSTEPRIRDG
jgi:hypothetical protein